MSVLYVDTHIKCIIAIRFAKVVEASDCDGNKQ